MLTFNLKKVWFEKIKNGEKTHEYREVKDFWTDRFVKEFFNIDKKRKPYDFELHKQGILLVSKGRAFYCNDILICFMNGMETEEKRPRLYARMKQVSIKNGLETDLKIDKDVYDIEFELIKDGE